MLKCRIAYELTDALDRITSPKLELFNDELSTLIPEITSNLDKIAVPRRPLRWKTINLIKKTAIAFVRWSSSIRDLYVPS